MRVINKKHVCAILSMAALSAVQAQTPVPPTTTNHHVASWMFNRPSGGLDADWYTYSDGTSTVPTTPPTSAFDSAMITPGAVQHVPSHCAQGQITFCRVPTGDTLLAFNNVPESGDSAYIDFPFSTAASLGSADVVLNQMGLTLNDQRYGTNFSVRADLIDTTANVTYPLLANPVPFSSVWSTINGTNTWAAYYFVRNTANWPLKPADAPDIHSQSGLPAIQTPIPLNPDKNYTLRVYFNATDGQAMIDDIQLFMQAVEVSAQNDGVDDPDYTLPAASGGTTPAVQANDQINNATIPEGRFTLTQLSADTGLTLDTSTGLITVAPGQPGTKTLTYALCPQYEQTLIPNFTSSACQQAVASVTLTGPAAPPQVSIACSPNVLTDSDDQTAICTLTADTTVTNPLLINVTPPANHMRYQTNCANPVTIAAGQSAVSCTITATANTTPGDGDVTATIGIVDNNDLYTVGTRSAEVEVQNDDAPQAVPTPVPSLQEWALILLSIVLAGFAAISLSRSRMR